MSTNEGNSHEKLTTSKNRRISIEIHGVDFANMSRESFDGLSRCNVPEKDRAVTTTRREFGIILGPDCESDFHQMLNMYGKTYTQTQRTS
jgi:hypothetical protein